MMAKNDFNGMKNETALHALLSPLWIAGLYTSPERPWYQNDPALFNYYCFTESMEGPALHDLKTALRFFAIPCKEGAYEIKHKNQRLALSYLEVDTTRFNKLMMRDWKPGIDYEDYKNKEIYLRNIAQKTLDQKLEAVSNRVYFGASQIDENNPLEL